MKNQSSHVGAPIVITTTPTMREMTFREEYMEMVTGAPPFFII
jgi:hypothetical protein